MILYMKQLYPFLRIGQNFAQRIRRGHIDMQVKRSDARLVLFRKRYCSVSINSCDDTRYIETR